MSKRFFSAMFAFAVLACAPMVAVASSPPIDPGTIAVKAFEPSTEQIVAKPDFKALRVVPAVLRSRDLRSGKHLFSTTTITATASTGIPGGSMTSGEPEPIPWRRI